MNLPNDESRIQALLAATAVGAAPPDHDVLRRMRDETASAFDAASAPLAGRAFGSRRRLFRWALAGGAAAAAVVITAVGLLTFTVPTRPAYGMADAAAKLTAARTLHVQAFRWAYGPDPQFPDFEKVTLLPMEYWIDVPGVRSHNRSFMSWSKADGTDRHLDGVETVCGGELQMVIRHAKKKVSFNRRTVLTNRLEARQLLQQSLHILSPAQVNDYRKVGSEKLGGRPFDIWERTHEGADRRRAKDGNGFEMKKYTMRIKCWLSAETGEVGRVEQWVKHEPTAMWRPEYFMEKVERDVTIPEEKFALKPPEGYELENTAETANESWRAAWAGPTGDAGDVIGYVAFTLEDGSVIAGWSVRPRDKEGWEKETDEELRGKKEKESRPGVAEAQRPVFAALKSGGPLPELPIAVAALRSRTQPYWPDDEVTYNGRHLASTFYDGRFIEWGLYVPEKKLPALPPNSVYVMRIRTGAEGAQLRDFNGVYGHPVRSRAEFDDFVRGAIAERADDGKPPAEVTYDNVTKLVEQARGR